MYLKQEMDYENCNDKLAASVYFLLAKTAFKKQTLVLPVYCRVHYAS
jgi:hypothetical protein